ncbi:MAG TPA: non-homologous end-joining DNA ligase [Bacteroidota bacterium]
MGLTADRKKKDLRTRQEPARTQPRADEHASRLLRVRGRTVEISNPGKLYWPDEAITKMKLVDYYRRVTPVLLPHLKDRPHALHRHPNGIGQPGFFQKNLLRGVPDWVSTVTVPAESTGRNVRYFVCADEASLMLMINMGCIEINPWFSRVGSLDRPDFLVFDLDPLETEFTTVVEVARGLKEILDRAAIPSVPKTSGATGMHIYVPLQAAYDYPTVRDFAELVVTILHEQMPGTTSLDRNPLHRKKKVYLDYLRNSFTQTLAAPYSVRPRPGAPVSTPLEWKEVGPGLDPRQHTMKTLPRRIDARGDLFRRVLGKGINLEAARKKLDPGRASARRFEG